jgi:phosphatidylserine decarboxylase
VQLRIPLDRDGWRFIAIFVALNAGLFLLWAPLGWLFLPFTIWCAAFFRDPERIAPKGSGLVISPADGKLLPVALAIPPDELGLGSAPRRRLSIFMDVFNVHVNRAPVEGQVVALNYRSGRFFNASFDKASEHNERMAIRMRVEGKGDENDLAVVQIAGLIARRIRCDLVEGQKLSRGERFGIIRFGSRLDVYLPPAAEVHAVEGMRVKAGKTVLARL